MNEAIVVLLQELGSEIRSRRDPEHTYTAAALGSFAAIVGGVAAVTALANVSAVPFWRHPALIGAVVCAVLSVLVVRKIERECVIYAALRQEQFKLVEMLREDANLKAEQIPAGLKSSAPTPSGHSYSTSLVNGAAIAAGAFCLAVWYGTITAAPPAQVAVQANCASASTPASGVGTK